MKDLQTLTDRLGIEVGTLRTAMSRLAKDGWVKRERQARNSFYTLSSAGTREFVEATRRIYAGQSDSMDKNITLAISSQRNAGSRLEQDKFLAKTSAFLIRTGCAVWRSENAPSRSDLEAMDFFVVSGTIDAASSWVGDTFERPELRQPFETMQSRWEIANKNVSVLHGLPPLDAMALRILLIHDWRRTILRQPVVPAAMIPEDWPEASCRSMVGTIYHAILPASEAWWSLGITPEGMDALEKRFPTQAPVTLRNFIDL